MESGQYTKNGPVCVQFFYYMNTVGSQKDSLTVHIKDSSSWGETFHTHGSHNGWNMGQATLRKAGKFTVITILNISKNH